MITLIIAIYIASIFGARWAQRYMFKKFGWELMSGSFNMIPLINTCITIIGICGLVEYKYIDNNSKLYILFNNINYWLSNGDLKK